MVEARPVVAVWKASWLPASQTFVQNQLAALDRWRAVLVGVQQMPDGLPVTADLAPFGRSPVGRALHRVSAATGHHGVYDRFLADAGAQLVHAHFGTSAVEVLPVARRNGLPLIVTFHGYDITSEPLRPGRAGQRYRRRLTDVFEYASRLIAVSDFVADRLVDLGAPRHKVQVHHIGIPTGGSWTPAADERTGVAFVGRFTDKKGLEDLIDAVALLDAPYRSTPLRIVGDGPRRPALQRRAAERGVAAEFLGYHDAAGVAETLRRSAVFCAPSKTAPSGDAEAFGMVFLEAALHGLPVVAYRHGGVPEAVEDGTTALLAPEGDVVGLAANLQLLLDDPERAAALGAAGRARVLEHFDVARQTAALEHLYDEVAARGRGRTPR